MKLLAMTFGEDPDGEVIPDQITVRMSLAEAVAIAKVFGKMNGYAYARLGLGDEAEVYNCLTGDVINRYWDDGLDHFFPPKSIDLATLNEPPS